nr:bifunctional UDP-sugar hydrolase/5'-nucleotidase [Paenibacillus turicensis]
MYTNDLHSHFDVMPRISAMVEEQRQQPNTDVLLLDIGDHMDRAFLETEGTMGKVNVDVLNLMRYDAITIGNNEGLTFTPHQLETVYRRLNCPVVCGNIKEKENNHTPDYMKPEVIIHKGNLRIGLIGATVPYTLFYDLLGIEASDPINTIASSVQRLRSQVDLIIVMSHMGLPFDQTLAETVEGIDVILGGHTHHLLEEPLYINNTAISAAGKFGRYMGRIVFDQPMRGDALKITEARCIPVEEGSIDEKVENCIDFHHKQAEISMGKSIAVIPNRLPIDYKEESDFGNLLAQAVRRCTGSEISIINSGQLLEELPAGEISEMMLHARCPSPINACKMTLLGKEIKLALEQSLLVEYYDKEIYGYGFRGKVLGGICADGIEIMYNPVLPDYHKISQIIVQGVPLKLEQQYSVGTLDMFTFGIGYEGLQVGEDKVYYLPQFLRDLLKQELQTPHAVENSTLKRWRIKTDI